MSFVPDTPFNVNFKKRCDAESHLGLVEIENQLQFVHQATYGFCQALINMHADICGKNFKGVCDMMWKSRGSLFLEYIRKVNFTGERISIFWLPFHVCMFLFAFLRDYHIVTFPLFQFIVAIAVAIQEIRLFSSTSKINEMLRGIIIFAIFRCKLRSKVFPCKRFIRFTDFSGDEFQFDRNGDGPARYNIIHYKQTSPNVFKWVKVGKYENGELNLNLKGDK